MASIVDRRAEGVSALPNEILLNVFNLLPTKSLIPLTPTCRHFHSLILRLIHNRLQAAAGLDGHSLYIECHHPSARLTAANLFCTSLGTDGLDDLSLSIQDEESYVGQIKRVGGLYSRFRPQRKESGANTSQRHPAGDVPGSRTHPSSSDSNNANRDVDEAVSETVTVDAHELFSQLSTFAYLGKREPTRGLLFSIQDVSEGMIRVWRDWLARQCERKTWTDGEPVVTHHDSASGSQNRGPDDGSGGLKDPTKDPSILWLNTRDDNVGIKFKVKERKWMRANPIMYSSEVEVPASYEVEFEEVLVRTTHLLLKIEEAEIRQSTTQTGKAIVFGAYRR